MLASALGASLPTPLARFVNALRDLNEEDRLWSIGVVTLALLVGFVAVALVLRMLDRWARHTETLDDTVFDHLRRPTRYLLPLIALHMCWPLLSLPAWLIEPLAHVTALGIVISIAWLAFAGVRMLEKVVVSRFDTGLEDNLAARAIHSQMRGFRNIARFLIVGAAVASALLTFESVRRFGVTLFASAGIAGIVIGFAAQKSIATLIAGVQIAITQPIRIDDVVVVEGEFGRIEEVTLTYVVVRIWDLRRLVLPITYFIDRPFQNWTRSSSNVTGTVYLYTDYSVPTDEVRSELKRILDASELWDGTTWGLQVTNIKEQSVELRATMSAPDASKSWDLRCEVREKLLSYVQERHPLALPRVRADIKQSG